MEIAITKLYYVAGRMIIIMSALLCFCIIAAYIDRRMTKINELYDTIKETVSSEDNPDRNNLRALTKFRQFRKEIPEFQMAVREKLKAYDLVPTTIEKTMSPTQLYKTNNPLWMHNFSIGVIKSIFILENTLGKDVVANKHINEFIQNHR